MNSAFGKNQFWLVSGYCGGTTSGGGVEGIPKNFLSKASLETEHTWLKGAMEGIRGTSLE